MSRRAGFVLAALLAGCQSTLGAGIPSPADAHAALNARFAGRPVQEALSRYGLPEVQFMSGNIRVLEWHTTGSLRFHEPVTTTTTGTIGGGEPWYQPIPYRQTSTSRVGYNVEYACTLHVGVRPDGTIDRVGLGGKMGACQSFMP